MQSTNPRFQQIWRWLLNLPNWGYAAFVAISLSLLFMFNTNAKPESTDFYAFDRPASRPNPPLTSVMGKPSLNVAKIEAVLRQYRSPAIGSGQAMYDLGLKYGIDPAFALAFFIHESSAGTKGVAIETKSIGNIRCTPGYECYQTQGNGAFRKYSSWESGIEDWYKLIKELYIGKWGLTTVEQILPVYAPVGDKNNPSAYAQHVNKLVTVWRNGRINDEF
jgi:hypothetical protein